MGRNRNRKAGSQEPLTLLVSKLSHEGRGIAHHEGRVIFVDGALPGETVIARVVARKGSYSEAVTETVEVASPFRVEPVCPYFQKCGGCSLQHLNSEEQLKFKEATLHERLRHEIGSTEYDTLEVISGPVTGYRRKARLAVRYVHKKDKVLVGFREKHSSFITDMDACAILDERVGTLLPVLSELVGNLNAKDSIPQIEIALGDPGSQDHLALVIRHLQPLIQEDRQKLENFASTRSISLYLQPKGPETVTKIIPQDTESRLYYSLPDFDLELAFHPMDFTQVNAGINRQMLTRAIDLLELKSTDRVLDLFCGLGNFTLAIATRAASVVGAEGVQAMVERGQENAARNALANIQFVCADLAKPPAEHAWLQQGFDKVLLDPPRSGAAEVLPAIVAANPERIVYVSCNPATLARDAAILRELGYQLIAAGAMDMFPHTSHVEAMAVFIRQSKFKEIKVQ